MSVRKHILIFFIGLFASAGSVGNAKCQGTWSPDSTNGLVDHTYCKACAVNDSIFIIGNDSLQTFDPSTHIWATPKTNGSFMYEGDGDILDEVNGKLYVLDYYYYNTKYYDTVKVFDLSQNTWYTPVTTGHFTPRDHFTSCAVNGKIYVIGGRMYDAQDSMDVFLSEVDVYDPSTNSWSTPKTSGTFTPREALTCSVVGGKIYVIGGIDTNFYPTDVMEVFDPSTNTWTTPVTTGYFTGRSFLTSSVLNGKIYVMGGDEGGLIHPSYAVQAFDPTTNEWTTPSTTGTFTARMGLASCTVGNKIYTMCGYRPYERLFIVEVYTPDNDAVHVSSQYIQTRLLQDPVGQSADFQFLPFSEPTEFELFDALGRTIVREEINAGATSLHLDMHTYPSGLYLARLGSETIRVMKNQ